MLIARVRLISWVIKHINVSNIDYTNYFHYGSKLIISAPCFVLVLWKLVNFYVVSWQWSKMLSQNCWYFFFTDIDPDVEFLFSWVTRKCFLLLSSRYRWDLYSTHSTRGSFTRPTPTIPALSPWWSESVYSVWCSYTLKKNPKKRKNNLSMTEITSKQLL